MQQRICDSCECGPCKLHYCYYITHVINIKTWLPNLLNLHTLELHDRIISDEFYSQHFSAVTRYPTPRCSWSISAQDHSENLYFSACKFISKSIFAGAIALAWSCNWLQATAVPISQKFPCPVANAFICMHCVVERCNRAGECFVGVS